MKKLLTQCVIALAVCAYVPVSAAPLPLPKLTFHQLKQFKSIQKETVATPVQAAQCGTVSNVIVITVVNCNETLATNNNAAKDEKVIK